MKKSILILVIVYVTIPVIDYHLFELSYAETKLFYFPFITAFLFVASSICFVGVLRPAHILKRFTLLILLFATYLITVHVHIRSVLWKQHLATPLTDSEQRVLCSKLPCAYNSKNSTIYISRCRKKELQDVLLSLSNISHSSHESAAEGAVMDGTNSNGR